MRGAFSPGGGRNLRRELSTTYLDITRCPTCSSDQINKVCRDWTGAYQGQSYVVPEVAFYECPVCGERVFDWESLGKIQARSPAFAKRSVSCWQFAKPFLQGGQLGAHAFYARMPVSASRVSQSKRAANLPRESTRSYALSPHPP